MTLRLRNYTLWVIVTLTLIVTAVCAYQWVDFLYGNFTGLRVQPSAGQSWLFLDWRWDEGSIQWVLYGLLIQGVLVLLGLLTVVRLFRQIISAHILLFAMVLFGIALQSGRIFQPIVPLGGSSPIGSIITRVAYFGHLLSVFSLLATSLFVSGSDYRKLGLVIGFSSFIALIIVYRLPINDFSLLPNLTHTIGRSGTVQITTLIVDLLAIVNSIYAGILHRHSSNYVLYIIAITAIVVGRQIVFSMPLPLLIIVGLVILAAGIVLFLVKSHSAQRWE